MTNVEAHAAHCGIANAMMITMGDLQFFATRHLEISVAINIKCQHQLNATFCFAKTDSWWPKT